MKALPRLKPGRHSSGRESMVVGDCIGGVPVRSREPEGADDTDGDRARPLFLLESIRKEFRAGGRTIFALQIDRLEIPRHQITCILGESGSGKTTLLNILGLLEPPDLTNSGARFVYSPGASGSIDCLELWRRWRRAILALRRKEFGFVFQEPNLLSHLVASSNVELFLRMKGMTARSAAAEARRMLVQLELGPSRTGDTPAGRLDGYPQELSGGEQQRVAVARALAGQPAVVLADEPTGSLDKKHRTIVADALEQAVAGGDRRRPATVLVVTHDIELADQLADLVVELDGGRIVRREQRSGSPARDPSSEAAQPRPGCHDVDGQAAPVRSALLDRL